jgi:ribosomal protein S18 acetylase RimI-like enzyme
MPPKPMSKIREKWELPEKLKKLIRIFFQGGFSSVFRTVAGYAAYHLKNKWRFVYFEYHLEQGTFSFKGNETITVRIAAPEDLGRIKSEIFPLLDAATSYDIRYFELIDQPMTNCFLAETGGRLVHYSWVFTDALSSPLMDTPFDKSKLTNDDAYIGPIFTSPAARGLIYLHVLPVIVGYLQENSRVKRILLLVDGTNPAAASFYKRLGFKEITDAQPKNILSYLWRGLSRATN